MDDCIIHHWAVFIAKYILASSCCWISFEKNNDERKKQIARLRVAQTKQLQVKMLLDNYFVIVFNC